MERELIAKCLALIQRPDALSAAERQLVRSLGGGAMVHTACVDPLRDSIRAGKDPLGQEFSKVRSALQRRSTGAVYTPATIVRSMTQWLAEHDRIERVIDPGAGSGRFTLAAGRAFPRAQLFAIETDPLAALMLRANLNVHGWSDRTTVLTTDYRSVELPSCDGTTAFIGNPPYLRHHDVGQHWKAWYAAAFARFGIKASALAGLHLHFLLKTRLLAKRGDVGAFITSAEWLDVNYGSALRRLFVDELGGLSLHVLEPAVEAFPGTASTAAIVCFRVGEVERAIRVRSVPSVSRLNGLTQGSDVARHMFRAERRWSAIVRPTAASNLGGIELGELFRVHRGQVTGANRIWIAGVEAQQLPAHTKVPAVTKAKDLIHAGSRLENANALRRVIDLPAELDQLADEERFRVDAFLAWARAKGAHEGYIARHRKAWWSVGLRSPAPILCTYMARRPPQFTLNDCGARHINVAHGLYPRAPITTKVLASLVGWLNANVNTASGRTYAGGLTKFEPKEIERLRVPGPHSFNP